MNNTHERDVQIAATHLGLDKLLNDVYGGFVSVESLAIAILAKSNDQLSEYQEFINALDEEVIRISQLIERQNHELDKINETLLRTGHSITWNRRYLLSSSKRNALENLSKQIRVQQQLRRCIYQDQYRIKSSENSTQKQLRAELRHRINTAYEEIEKLEIELEIAKQLFILGKDQIRSRSNLSNTGRLKRVGEISKDKEMYTFVGKQATSIQVIENKLSMTRKKLEIHLMLLETGEEIL